MICAVVIGLLMYDLAAPLGSRNLQLYSKWVECGTRPLQTITKPTGIAWYEKAPVIAFIRVFDQPPFYCTPEAAERAGLSANPDQYYFPHLSEP